MSDLVGEITKQIRLAPPLTIRSTKYSLTAFGGRLMAAGDELVYHRDGVQMSILRKLRRGQYRVQAEIDLIAYDGPTLCFVEVKTRASDRFAAPEANVDLRKQRQITRAARAYRRLMGLAAAPYRYDVVSVILPPPGEDGIPLLVTVLLVIVAS